WILNRLQARLDQAPDRLNARRQSVFSGPGLVVFGLACTGASIDWLMSLEPTWYSTIFPLIVVMGMALLAFAFAIAAAVWLEAYRPFVEVAVDRAVWNDLGNLLLAVIMLWAYMAFSQLLLIWSGNLPEEITWYYKRSQLGWEYLAAL